MTCVYTIPYLCLINFDTMNLRQYRSDDLFHDRLREAAQRTGKTMSEIIREAVAEWIQKHTK